MNQTEAYEAVLAAAMFYSSSPQTDMDRKVLLRALRKVGPKVDAMRRRLDAIRARVKERKKTAAGMPPWLERATR